MGDSSEVNRFVDGVEILSNQKGGARMGYPILESTGWLQHSHRQQADTMSDTRSGDRYRRLTNVEYARIQGFPDDHCSAISVYDQYALFGNAVPPPMAEWVMGA